MPSIVFIWTFLHAAARVASSEIGEPRPSHAGAHGYRSSVPWLPREAAPLREDVLASTPLPKDFDWRNVGGRSFVTADLNQHIPMYCGSCWIHGTVHSLNDRIKIMRNARFPDVLLSRQALMNCVPDPSSSGPPPGCNGGDAWMIYKYMEENKVPDDSCMPYVGKNLECLPKNICRNCFHNQTIEPDGHPFFTPGPCFGVENWIGYGVTEYGSIKGEAAMMKEIYARGPIPCNTATDDTFVLNYTLNQGILDHNVYITDVIYTPAQIDHVMEVAGWGETKSGVKYWVVRNSWGTYWGDMGWVKIRRGVDQQLIESGGCDWAVPNVHDVEEGLKGRVMGDYVRGIKEPTMSERLTASAAEVKEAPTIPTEDFTSAVVAATLGGAIVGSVITRIMAKRDLPVQTGLLG